MSSTPLEAGGSADSNRRHCGMSAHCGDQAGRVCRFAGDSAFRRPFRALPARMLDDRVRAGEDQARVTVVETHEVGRLAARSADLDDLARPLWMAHDVAMHVEPVPDDCLHTPASSSAFAGGMSAPGAARAPKDTLQVYPDCHDQHPPSAPVDCIGHARCRPGPLAHFFGFPSSMNSSLFAVEVAMARPPSSLR